MKINQIILKCNFNKLLSDFTFYEIKAKNSYEKTDLTIELLQIPNVLSVLTTFNALYVMSKQSVKFNLPYPFESHILNSETFKKDYALLLNLLLLSIQRKNNPNLKNTTCYLHYPMLKNQNLLERKSNQRILFQVKFSNSISNSDDILLDVQQRTYTKYKALDERKKKSWQSYGSNVFGYDFEVAITEKEDYTKIRSFMLKEIIDNNKILDDLFFCGQKANYKGKKEKLKNGLNFFDINYNSHKGLQREDYYMECKHHIYHHALHIINQEYSEYLSISFKDMNDFLKKGIQNKLNPIQNIKKNTDELENELNEFFNGKTINILSSDNSLEFENNVIVELKKLPFLAHCKIIESATRNKNALNVVCIMPKEYYASLNYDDYIKSNKDQFVMQHITNDTQLNAATLKKICIELMIKWEIQKGIINSNLLSFMYKNEIKTLDFFQTFIDENNKETFVLNTNSTENKKSTYLLCKTFNDVPKNIYTLLVGNDLSPNNFYIIEDNHYVYCLKKTELISLIGKEEELIEYMSQIPALQLSGQKNISIRAKKNMYLIDDLYNIKYIILKDLVFPKGYTVAGCNLYGCGRNLHFANHLYSVETLSDNTSLENYAKFIDLYNVSFITTSDRFTVKPFPFKFISEYYEMVKDK